MNKIVIRASYGKAIRSCLKGVRILNRKFVLRYLILIAILAVCAGAAWYMASTSGTHAADTVLAGKESRTGKYAMLQRIIPAETVSQKTDHTVLQEKVPAGYGILCRNISSESSMTQENPEGRML